MKTYALFVSILLTIVVVPTNASAQSGSTPEQPRVFLDTTYAPPTGTVRQVAAGSNLQTVLNAAVPGDTIVLAAGATFTGNFSLPNKAGSAPIYIRTSTPDSQLPPPGTRVDPSMESLMPKIVTANSMPAMKTQASSHNYRFVGIEFAVAPGIATNYGIVVLGDSAQTSLAVIPHDIVIDRCWIHGNASGNVSRGVALNAASASVVDSYVSDCRGVGFDTQALCGWNGPGPFKIFNNYLEGAGENVLFGGADPKVPNLVPSDIEIRRNTFSKPLSWCRTEPTFDGVNGDLTKHWTVKNVLELKNARRVLVDGNTLENCWVDGQMGFALVLTPRNQGGTATWTAVQDVTFTNNTVQHAAGGVNVLGYDDVHVSQQMQRVRIANNLFVDIGGTRWGSNGRWLQIKNASSTMTVDHNTAFQTGNVLTSGAAPNTGFVFTNNIAPHNQYGVIGTGFGTGTPTLNQFFPGCVFSRNVLCGGDAALYPPVNYFPSAMNGIGFVDYAGGNYRLAASSPYKGQATDGTDVGADIDALLAAGSTTVPPPPPPPAHTPTVSNVTSSSITTTSAVVAWNTDDPSDSAVDYGPSTDYASATSVDPAYVTEHRQTLTGLQPNTVYHYCVRSTNASAMTGVSPDLTFTTAPEATAGTGNGLAAEYFNDTGDGVHFRTSVLRRTDATVNFDWASGSPAPIVQTNNFSVRWTGKVEAPVTGNYIFSTVSNDGVKLWVNGQLVVSNWTDHAATTNASSEIHLVAGVKYDLKMEFYDHTGASKAVLQWYYPGQPRQPIPQSHLYSTGTGTGLKGEYFDTATLSTLVATRVDPTISFDWGSGAPIAGMGVDTFSVRWTGKIQPTVSGVYTFYTTTNDGVRLWVNGQLVVDKWVNQGATTWSGATSTVLQAGELYDIKMEFYENTLTALAKLEWTTTGVTRQVVPQTDLFPAP